jgi:hypothetical protein
MPYNNPKFLLFTATFGAMINGSTQPILGVVFAKILSLLSAPMEMLEV